MMKAESKAGQYVHLTQTVIENTHKQWSSKCTFMSNECEA